MRHLFFFIFSISLFSLFFSCQQQAPNNTEQVYQPMLQQIRLGDGVALDLQVAVRYRYNQMTEGAIAHDSILEKLLYARSLEHVREVSNAFQSVDSVFASQRNYYVSAIKAGMTTAMDLPGINVQEVIVMDVGFPTTFTSAMEQISLQELEEQRIDHKNQLDLAQAEANKKKAQADGDVAIARAEAEGRLQAIQARTEENRRKSEMARAETAAAVARTAATAEADRLRKIKAVETEQQRDIEMIAVEKQRALDQVALEQQLELAQLCETNPVYASFLVNRELASNVEIAVLPSGTDANVFGGLLQSRLPGKQD